MLFKQKKNRNKTSKKRVVSTHTPGRAALLRTSLLINIEKGWSLFSSKTFVRLSPSWTTNTFPSLLQQGLGTTWGCALH